MHKRNEPTTRSGSASTYSSAIEHVAIISMSIQTPQSRQPRSNDGLAGEDGDVMLEVDVFCSSPNWRMLKLDAIVSAVIVSTQYHHATCSRRQPFRISSIVTSPRQAVEIRGTEALLRIRRHVMTSTMSERQSRHHPVSCRFHFGLVGKCSRISDPLALRARYLVYPFLRWRKTLTWIHTLCLSKALRLLPTTRGLPALSLVL